MIEEFDLIRLERQRAFLEIRAKTHLNSEINRQWHQCAAATLLRDAGAVAFIIGDIDGGRLLLRQSGALFFEIGFAGGLQLLYIAGALDTNENEARSRVDKFETAFYLRDRPSGQPSIHLEFRFDEASFRPPQLLRIYQALAGRLSEDEKWSDLRGTIYSSLMVNSTMPVGATRIPISAYLSAYDQVAKRVPEAKTVATRSLKRVLGSLVERREELIMAARRDRFHWKALLRPAELIDFDLLALLVAGTRRGKRSKLIASVFTARDPITALPQTLAKELGKRTKSDLDKLNNNS
ncbi:hypothetical protein [Bradyrhizobium sp.]|uniref:hypothetical protein n=1 Tax=Bradyrhizobium sp. TaxID=376 RepID=UPI000A905325|nr:hypothetical protein [Bradyrhizobium sp.]